MSFLTNATDVAIEQDLKQFLIILLIALGAAILPKIFASLRQIPYTLLLVMVGLGVGDRGCSPAGVEKCLANGYAESVQQSIMPLSDRITKISLDTKTCL